MKKTWLTLFLSLAIFPAFAQGTVNFYNDTTSPVTALINGVQAPIDGHYYFVLVTSSNPSGPFNFAGLYATNAVTPGLYNGGAGVFVPGWPSGVGMYYQIVAWSASLGNTFNNCWLDVKFPCLCPAPPGTVFGVSGVGYGMAGGPVTYDSTGQPITHPPLDLNMGFSLTPPACAPAPFSSTQSTLTATPGSALADGQSAITLTTTLQDSNGHPVPGKTLRVFTSERSLNVSQPAGTTDANGKATATLKATAPAIASIWAIDTTDSIIIQQQAIIQFITGFVVPDSTLSGAIMQLGNSSDALLTQSLANYAIREGTIGDYFANNMAGDKRVDAGVALSAGVGGLLTLLGPEMSVLNEVALSLDQDIGSFDLSSILDAIATSSAGLTAYGQKIANVNSHFQDSLAGTEQQLLKGVLPSSEN